MINDIFRVINDCTFFLFRNGWKWIICLSALENEDKKKKRGKKTPLEFEKRLIAGTKRYYMSKLGKMRSKISLDMDERSKQQRLLFLFLREN